MIPDFDFRGLFIGIALVGVGFGIALMLVLPWLWSLLKPLLHAATG